MLAGSFVRPLSQWCPLMRLARCETLDPDQVNVVHVYNRTVRRCFLMGQDPYTGKNYQHRKVWIEDSLRHFAGQFGIDLLGFAIMSNHFHLILRTRPEVVKTWDDDEVAHRWLMICPKRRTPEGQAKEPTEAEIRSISGCPVKLQQIRSRLSDIAWWIRLLCQRIATRSNREDEQTGRFFQDRYKATLLTDEASLLACAAYVDLNPIRAAMAQTIEASDHTSIQRRAESIKPDRLMASDFLSPLTINEASDPTGPCASSTGKRCSDKGFLAMSLADYVQLLDWLARTPANGKRGSTPQNVAPVLQRLGLDAGSFAELSRDFGKLFSVVAGCSERVDAMRTCRTGRRYHLRRRARELMTVGVD